MIMQIVLPLAMLLQAAASDETGRSPMLENEHLKIVLDPATGGFASIFDKHAQHEYIAAPDCALPFRLMTPEGDEAYRHLDGTKPDIRIEGNRALLAYAIEGVRAEVALELNDDELRATLHIENNGRLVIEEVMFPCVRGVGEIEKGSFIWPQFCKRKYDDLFSGGLGGTHHTWNEFPQKMVMRYPAHLASAWCDYGNDQHGISLEARHTDFSMVDFYIYKRVEKDREPIRKTLDFTTVFPRRIKPGEQYTSPPIVISAHQKDWHAVAGRHRDWLSTWIAKPERPAKFAEDIGWHFFFMKHQDGLVLNTYNDLPAMAQAALEAGCHYLLLFGWQIGGHDNNYCYRYVPNPAWGGEEALRENIAKCRALRVEPIPFFNGTLANIEMPEHKEFGYKWEAKTRTGHPYYAGDWARHNFDAPTRNRAMLHTELSFCKEHQAFFTSTAKRIAQQYGFGNLQLDQISEKMLVDYDEAHITSTPDRVAPDGLAAMLPEVRRMLREQNPEGVIVGEAINDFTGQWCDSSWDWNVLLPFPEPIFYTLPWLMGSHEIDALEYGEVNKAFVYKLHLDMKIDGGDARITKYPKFAARVKSIADLRRQAAPYIVQADFVDQQGIECTTPDEVYARTYRNSATKKFGVAIANVDDEPSKLTLRITEQAAGTATLHSNKKPAQTIDPTQPLTLDLEPYEACAVCIDTP